MNDLSKYILEKLKINKNIKLPELYHPGDRCLVITFSKPFSKGFLSVDVAEIKKITENKLYYTYLTGFAHAHARKTSITAESEIIKDKGNYWHSVLSIGLSEIFIPQEESLEIINKLGKTDKYQKFFDLLGYIPEIFDSLDIKKDDKFDFCKYEDSLNLTPYTTEDIKKLKKCYEFEYIDEKLRINKDINTTDPLDKVFKDIYELVDSLNIYLNQDLAKPIKIVNSEVCFRPDGPYGHNGVYVKEHFMIEFNYSATRIRFGYREKDYGLTMQFIYYNPNQRSKYSYGYMRKEDGYKFGKDNFLEWLKNPKETKLKRVIKDYFRLNDDE